MRDLLEQLVAEGKVRCYGWSTDDPERARLFAQGEHCAAVQHNFNVIDDAPAVLAVCDEYDQASIARGPLARGFLSGKYTIENLDTALAKHDFRATHRDRILKFIQKSGALGRP